MMHLLKRIKAHAYDHIIPCSEHIGPVYLGLSEYYEKTDYMKDCPSITSPIVYLVKIISTKEHP
jgi:hypothetical protein